MAKVPVFLAMLLLAGSTPTVYVSITSSTTSITLPGGVVRQHADSPLSKDEWVMAASLQSVPVFLAGTSIADVRAELVRRNLQILREWPGYMVVREGVPLIDTSGPVRLNFIYGFDNGALVLGPLTFAQAAARFVADGLTDDQLQTLHLFVSLESDNPGPFNDYAWLLATHPDGRVRNGELAVEYALRALALDEEPEPKYVDTLAAAYAATGNFRRAVEEQRRAIDLSRVDEPGFAARLRLYTQGERYVASPADLAFNEDATDEFEKAPRADLVRNAASGDAEAQWRLAIYYIERDIMESDGVVAPGVFWLREAARNGHPYAANEAGWCYMMAGCGVAQDYAAAVAWFREGVNVGDVTAAFNLGRMLAIGYGEQRNETEATQLLTLAANNGIHAAAFNVAFRYGQGLGSPVNHTAQNAYLRQVEAAGYGIADYLLDDVFFQRFQGAAAISAALDRADVQPWEAAEAIMDIAGMFTAAYQRGGSTFEVRFDDDATYEYASEYGPYLIFTLVRISASLGSARAQHRMAEYYEQGDIVPRSLPEAHYWRSRAER